MGKSAEIENIFPERTEKLGILTTLKKVWKKSGIWLQIAVLSLI